MVLQRKDLEETETDRQTRQVKKNVYKMWGGGGGGRETDRQRQRETESEIETEKGVERDK